MTPLARNRFHARVTAIVEAPILSEVEVELADGQLLVATIPTRELDAMGVRVGAPVVASLKATDVSVAVG